MPTPPPSPPAPEQTTAGVADPVVQDSGKERSPPTTEQNPPPKSPPPQARQPPSPDAQKKKEQLLKEQRKLKQSQLSKHTFSGAPAYVAVTPTAKGQHMGLGQQPASTQPPAPAPDGTVATVQQSLNLVRFPPGSTLKPR